MDPTALTEQTGADQQQQQQDGGAGSDQQQKPAKPDGFPEALSPYWNDDTGFDYAKAGEDHAALSTLKAENDARLAAVPENIDDYEVALPEGFDIPEGLSFEALKDHPMLADARAFAKEQGLTRDQFKSLIGLEARRQIAEHKQLVEASAAERTKLGTKATQRIDAVAKWTQAQLGNDLAQAVLPMMYTARQIEAFEKLMTIAKAAGTTVSAGGREANQPAGLTDDEWNAMSPTAKIEWGRKNPASKAA